MRSRLARVAMGHVLGSGITLVACGVVAVLLGSSSCSFKSSSDASRSQLTATLGQLASETDKYNKHSKDEYPGNPNQFMKDATGDLSAMRASAGDWKSAAAEAQLGPTPQDGWPSQAEVASFAMALDGWIVAQQEQVDVIRSCMATVDQGTCMQSSASQDSGRWVDAHTQLMNAYKTMTNGTKLGAGTAGLS